MKKLTERINYAMQVSGIKKAVEFAEKSGIAPTYLSALRSGKREKVSLRVASNIAKVSGLAPLWILSGDGPRELKTDQQKEINAQTLADRSKELDLEDQELVLAFTDLLITRAQPKQKPDDPK